MADLVNFTVNRIPYVKGAKFWKGGEVLIVRRLRILQRREAKFGHEGLPRVTEPPIKSLQVTEGRFGSLLVRRTAQGV